MPTSGIDDYRTSSIEIITEALELLGVLGEGESPTDDQTISSQRTLNMMVKSWQGKGLNLFSVAKRIVQIVPGQEEYYLIPKQEGLNGNLALYGEFPPVDRTSIEVSNIDLKGGELMIGIHAYTGHTLSLSTNTGINSQVITGSLTTAFDTILVAVSPAMESEGYMSAWITPPGAPLPLSAEEIQGIQGPGVRSILEAYYVSDNTTDVPLKIISRSTYNDLSNKGTLGVPNQINFDPQRLWSTIRPWPTGNTGVNGAIEIHYQRSLESFIADGDEPDYPQEWFMALAYNLARSLAPKYGTPQMDYARILQQARELYEDARGFDTELETAVYLSPDVSWGG